MENKKGQGLLLIIIILIFIAIIIFYNWGALSKSTSTSDSKKDLLSKESKNEEITSIKELVRNAENYYGKNVTVKTDFLWNQGNDLYYLTDSEGFLIEIGDRFRDGGGSCFESGRIYTTGTEYTARGVFTKDAYKNAYGKKVDSIICFAPMD